MDLKMYYGDTSTKTVTVYDGEGDVVDISGDTLIFTVKILDTDSDDNIVLQKTLTVKDQSLYEGQATLPITSVDSRITVGNYYYDIEWTDISSRTVVYNPADLTTPSLTSTTTLQDGSVSSFIDENIEVGQSIVLSSMAGGSASESVTRDIEVVTADTITLSSAVTASFLSAFNSDGDYDVYIEKRITVLTGLFTIERDVYHH